MTEQRLDHAAGATWRARSGCARCSITARTASAPTSTVLAGSAAHSRRGRRRRDTWRNIRHELN